MPVAVRISSAVWLRAELPASGGSLPTACWTMLGLAYVILLVVYVAGALRP